MVAGSLSPETSRGQVVGFVFGQTDLAASQTDVQLVAAIAETGQAVDGITMPWPGGAVALAFDLTTNKTAGVMTVGVTIDGTEVAATTQTVANSVSAGRATFARGAARFAAGAKLGVELTTDGSFTPITADLFVVVYVLFRVDGISMATKRYKFVKDYRSGHGVWTAGQEIEVDEDEAAWLNRDVDGCLEPVEDPAEVAKAAEEAEIAAKATADAEAKATADAEAAERAADKPPADRMQRQAPAKRDGG